MRKFLSEVLLGGIRQLYSFDGVGMNQGVREVRQSAFGIKKGCLMTSAPEM